MLRLSELFLLVFLVRCGLCFCPQHCACVNKGERATVKCPPQSDLEVNKKNKHSKVHS